MLIEPPAYQPKAYKSISCLPAMSEGVHSKTDGRLDAHIGCKPNLIFFYKKIDLHYIKK